MIKQILKYLPFALLLAIAIAAIVYTQKQQKEAVCKQISISIDSDSVGNQLLVDEDVLQILAKHNDTVGKKIQDFDLLQIERRVRENSFVYTAQSYFDMHNTLHIRITQRVPFVRIMAKTNDDYYIDTAGWLLPLSAHFAPRVLVASGEIAEAYKKNHNLFAKAENDTLPAKHTILHDIVFLNRAIAADPLLQAAIEQIYVLENNEMYLISKIGPPQIIFGSIDNYRQKLQNLKAFYQSQKSQENWNKYKAINIKYSNQVVAIEK